MVRCFNCLERIERDEEEWETIEVEFRDGDVDMPFCEDCAS